MKMAKPKPKAPDLVLRATVLTNEEGEAVGVYVVLERPKNGTREEMEYLPLSPQPEEALLEALVSALDRVHRYQPRLLRLELAHPNVVAILRRERDVPEALRLPYMQVRSRLNMIPRVEIPPPASRKEVPTSS
jgi:hypothetical protein